jgi:diamine N-acetyltransferase
LTYLSALEVRNLELYRQNRNNPEIMKWCRQRAPISEYEQELWYERQAEDPSIQMFQVNKSCNDQPVGVCGLTSIDHVNRRAEFSLYIFADQQGNGYGERALRTLVDYGFNELNLNMIFGETVGENPATAMFEKVGFVNTGYRPAFYYKGGEYHNSYMFCIEVGDDD